MGFEETLTDIFVNWSSLILSFYILGTGYLGLMFVDYLRTRYTYTPLANNYTLFDKIMRSLLLGFISFSLLLSLRGTDMTNQVDVLEVIKSFGLSIFVVTAITSILIAYLFYILFDYLPAFVGEMRSSKKPIPRKKKREPSFK